MRILVVIALFVAGAVNVAAQQVSGQATAQARAHAIATAFNKRKDAVKVKLGAPREKFKDVRTEPLVKQHAREYAGTYEVPELGFVINLEVGSDGRIQASGSEQGEQSSRSFKLENAKIEGALLTAAKVYPDGSRERFEGAFLSRSVRNSPAAAAETTLGLGVLLPAPFEVNGLTYDKLFYELKR